MNYKFKITTLILVFLNCFLNAQIKVVKSSLDSDLSEPDRLKKIADSSFNYFDKGEFGNSFKLNLRFLKLAKQDSNNYYIHKAYSNLGYDYLIQRETSLAENCFKESIKYAELSNNIYAKAVTYVDLANILIDKKDQRDIANTYYTQAVNAYLEIDDIPGLVGAYFNIIYAAMRHNDLDKASIYIDKLEHILYTRDDYDGDICKIALDNLKGEYYYKIGKYDKSQSVLRNVIDDALLKNLNLELENAFLIYSKSLETNGMYKESLEARVQYEEYHKFNDSVRESEESKSLANKYKVEQYKEQIESVNKESSYKAEILKSKNQLNKLLLALTLLFLFFSFYLIFLNKKKKKLNNELKKTNKEYLESKKNSENSAKVKSDFFSTVSHELRTPLYGVVGLSSILLERNKDEAQTKDLNSLKYSADYLLALVNNVLKINKIDSNIKNDTINVFKLNDLLFPIIESFKYRFDQNNNIFEKNIDSNIPVLLKGNSFSLSQILMNLIGNACKFTEDGTITLSIKKLENNLVDKIVLHFDIIDTGIGIPNDKLDFIFQEFKQLSDESYEYQGTGLGLPIVSKLLKKRGEEIKVTSEYGKGSTFSFKMTFDIVPLEEQIKIKMPDYLYDARILKNKKFLIVDDNKINQVVTEKILSKIGILSDSAYNGQEAIDKVKSNDYDLILMDINMPVKNGLEATKEIRTFNKIIPIIALTAVEIEEMRVKINDSGMNDIIVKPYDSNLFYQIIAKNISKANGLSASH